MDALKKLQQINASHTLSKAIETKCEKDGISEDQITLDIEEKMKPSTDFAATVATQAQQIDYYKSANPEQFEQLKNNPSLPAVAERYVAEIIIDMFSTASADLIAYFDDPELTMEVYLRAIGFPGRV